MPYGPEPSGRRVQLRSTAPGLTLSPPAHAAALADAAARGEFDSTAFEQLDRALRNDELSGDDLDLLPLLAPILMQEVPDHPMIGIVRGLHRRSLVRASTAQRLTEAIETEFADLGIATLVAGDLGAARHFYRELGDRSVRISTVIVPREVPRGLRRTVIAQAAEATGASTLAGRLQGLERFGARTVVSTTLGPAFAFPAARRWLWQTAVPTASGRRQISPEVLLLESMYQSALGAPRIRWYADAVCASNADEGIRWEKLMAAAQVLGWAAPVREAMRILAASGQVGPQPHDAADNLLNRAYWNARRSTPFRTPMARLRYRSLWAARIAGSWPRT